MKRCFIGVRVVEVIPDEIDRELTSNRLNVPPDLKSLALWRRELYGHRVRLSNTCKAGILRPNKVGEDLQLKAPGARLEGR